MGRSALSAYRQNIPYVALTLGDAHARFVTKHVASQTANDALYDPRLVATLRVDEPETPAT